jgi:hypothetical protein
MRKSATEQLADRPAGKPYCVAFCLTDPPLASSLLEIRWTVRHPTGDAWTRAWMRKEGRRLAAEKGADVYVYVRDFGKERGI